MADLDELIRLRAVMFASMDIDPRTEVWDGAARRLLADGFGDATAHAVVADHPDGGGRLVACGVATVERRLPSPNNPTGRHGYIASMVTDPGFRRRGLARQIMEALLDWLEGQGVTSSSLHATEQGAPLYRSLGFREPHTPELRRRVLPG